MALTERKQKYAEARIRGLEPYEAAISAGCPEKSAKRQARRLEKDPDVLAAMGRQISVNDSAKEERSPADLPDIPDAWIPDGSEDSKDFLIGIMSDPQASPKMRFEAARALLPYQHAKVGESGKKGSKNQAAKEAGKGKFAAGRPPLKAVK